MAEAYFGLRRTRKRTHPNRCPCCNSENESEHHANDEKQEEVVNSSIYSSQPKRSSRIHSKKEKKVKKNEQEKSKSSFQSTDTEVEKNSDVSSNQRSSWQASPGKQRPTRSKRGKAKKSGASVNKNSKINLSGQDQVENLGENFEEKTFRQTEIDFKKRNKKGKKIEAKSVKDWDLKNLNVQKKKKTNKQFCSAAESKEKSSIPQFLNSTERTIKKKNKNLSPKGIYDGGSSITIQDVSIRDSNKKGKGAKKFLSSSVEDNNKKPFVSKEDFDDADDLPLSFTKATVLETRKSNKKTSKDNKVNIQNTKPSAPEMGAQKMKVSYSNFDEMSRNKLEAFDHVFKELKKCPGYSKLTVSGAVDIVMKIGKEQLKPIINSLDMHSDKKRSSTHKNLLPRENDQLSPLIKKKRKTPTNSEENESRSKETAKENMSKDTDYTFVSNSPPKIDCNAEKRQEMNECQAAEALLNFKIKPAVSRSDSFNSTKSNLSSKEEAGEAVTERNSSLTSDTVGEREVSVSLNSINIESATKTSSTSTAESLLQTQSKTSQMSNEMIGESEHAPMPAPHQPSAVPNVQASQLSSIATLQPVDTDLNEAVKGMVEHNKASENSVSITDQVAKAIDSLGHIFDQNQRQFSGFPLPTVMPQNPGFNPVTWPQTISASMGQFGNVSASLPSNVHPVAPPGLNQITPQAFTHVLSQVMSQSKQSLLPVMPGNPSTPQAFLPTAGPLGLGPQQSSQTSPMSITDTQPKPNNQPVTQPKSQLPLKSMEEIVGNVGQTGIPQAVGWSFPTSQAPVVYLASPQTLGGVPRNIVPSTQGSGGVHLGQESIFKPVSSKVTMTKPDLAPASGLSRTTQGVTQTILSTIGKRPILPREKATSSFVQPETVAAHKLPPVVSLATSRTTASKQNPLYTSNLVSSQQKAVSANVTLTTTANAKQAVKKLVRERTKSAELKRQDSFGSGSDGVSPSALQPSKSQITRPNEFNVEQAASALLSIGKTESPEGNIASQGDDGQDGQDEKVVFTSKGMFRVGDVEVDPQYNRIGREGYTCGKCGKIFTSLNYLARHIKRVCPDMSCRKWKCNQCDKAFRHPFGLQQHVYTHTGERPHKCSQCPKAFYSSNDLRRHSRIHSGERPYRCKHCDKSFATTISLKTHTYIHTGEKPHKCPHCPKTFATSSKLGRHIVTHSEQRPFACQQCPKSFNRSGDLRRHSLHVHENNEKPFECDECFKPFATSVCLKIHKNIHKVAQTSNDNEKPFKCSTCDRTYDSSTQLEKHQMTHVPSAPLGYNYKQFHPIAPKPSDPEGETGNAESSEAKLI